LLYSEITTPQSDCDQKVRFNQFQPWTPSAILDLIGSVFNHSAAYGTRSAPVYQISTKSAMHY